MEGIVENQERLGQCVDDRQGKRLSFGQIAELFHGCSGVSLAKGCFDSRFAAEIASLALLWDASLAVSAVIARLQLQAGAPVSQSQVAQKEEMLAMCRL